MLEDPERTDTDAGRTCKLHTNETLDLICTTQIRHQRRKYCSLTAHFLAKMANFMTRLEL